MDEEWCIIHHEDTPIMLRAVDEIRTWLKPTEYSADSGEFRRHLASRAPGTGSWIFETEEYRQWHDSDERTGFWINGAPGVGKSVTAAAIIHHLRATEDCPVLFFFFFRNTIAANLPPRVLLKDWLFQLLPHSPRLQEALGSRKCTPLAETSDLDLFRLLINGAQSLPRVYCVADGLDEANSDDHPFLDLLNDLITRHSGQLKLLMTSRPGQHLQSALRDTSIVHIALQQSLVAADIHAFVRHRIAISGALRSIDQQPLAQEIIAMVTRRSKGNFVLAKLVMNLVEDSLREQMTVDLTALEDYLPADLEQAYINILAKQRAVYGVSTDVQILLLEAITYASRPLRLNELAALVSCLNGEVIDPTEFKALVAGFCGPLVEILEDDTLRIVHDSFTEFLRGDTRSPPESSLSSNFPVFSSFVAHKRMTIGCLQYLQSGSLALDAKAATRTTGEKAGAKEARLQYPFLDYAVTGWTYHASQCDAEDEELFTAFTSFCNHDNRAFQRWVTLVWPRGFGLKLPSALHIAAFAGLSQYAAALIEQGSSVLETDDCKRTPLHWAANQGHAKVASLLIEHGCYLHGEDSKGRAPIHLAAMSGHASVLKVLLEAGVRPGTFEEDVERKLGRTSQWTEGSECVISFACGSGNRDAIRALVPFCNPEELERLLCECCRFGRDESVIFILEGTDVSANAVYNGATALDYACRSASPQCVEALLRHGADVQKTSTEIYPGFWHYNIFQFRPCVAPLHRLVDFWTDSPDISCQAVLQILLEAGADLEQRDGSDKTPLLLAAGGFQQCPPGKNTSASGAAVKALVAAGADVKVTDQDGNRVLHLVLENSLFERDPDIVGLLMEKGADPNVPGKKRQTALDCMLSKCTYSPLDNIRGEVVEYLLKNGARFSDSCSEGVLSWAMRQGPGVFRERLQNCHDDKIKTQLWFGLAWSSSPLDHFEPLVEAFLADGFDIEARDSQQNTMFTRCYGSKERLSILRSQGADANAVDEYGNNVLHLICDGPRPQQAMLEHAIALGTDPFKTDGNGNTLLHTAALGYNETEERAGFIRWLVSLGIPINAVDHDGRTALHKCFSFNEARGKGPRIHFVDVIKDCGQIDFEIRDKHGRTALHEASRSERDLAKMVDAGASLSTLTGDSKNVLHLLCRARKPGIIAQVLSHPGQVDVNQTDRDGRTPLHHACEWGDPECVAILLSHGADTNAWDRSGYTPLHMCASAELGQHFCGACYEEGFRCWLRSPREESPRPEWKDEQCCHKPRVKSDCIDMDSFPRGLHFPSIAVTARLLLDAGADPDAVASTRSTALDMALETECMDFVEVFASNNEAQMTLAQYPPSLGILRQDPLAFEEALEFPYRYFDLLSCDEAAELINRGHPAHWSPSNYGDFLETLIKPDRLELVRRVHAFILDRSNYDSLVERGQSDSKYPVLTALQYACERSGSNMLMVRCLVEEIGVDVNAHSAASRYPCEHDMLDTLKPRPGITALHTLAETNHFWQLEALRYLIARGADVNAVDEMGRSPLHVAARGIWEGSTGPQVIGFWTLQATRILLDAGADPNLLDNEGSSPLVYAAGSPEILSELLQRGTTRAGVINVAIPLR